MFDHGRALAAGWDDDAEFVSGGSDAAREGSELGGFGGGLLSAGQDQLPPVRARLHSILALYAHAPTLEKRLKLLDLLEDMALQIAAVMAAEMLEAGWRPDSGPTAQTGVAGGRSGLRAR